MSDPDERDDNRQPNRPHGDDAPGTNCCAKCETHVHECGELHICECCSGSYCNLCLSKWEDVICKECVDWLLADVPDNLRLARAVLRGIEEAYRDYPTLANVVRDIRRLCTPRVCVRDMKAVPDEAMQKSNMDVAAKKAIRTGIAEDIDA